MANPASRQVEHDTVCHRIVTGPAHQLDGVPAPGGGERDVRGGPGSREDAVTWSGLWASR